MFPTASSKEERGISYQKIADSSRFGLEMPSSKLQFSRLLAFRKDTSSRDVPPPDPVPALTTPTTANAKNPSPLRSSSPRNLWEEAFKKLTAEEKLILTKEPHKEPLVILEDVILQVEKRSREHQSAGWKVHRRGSKPDFNIHDGAVKVLKSVMSFKDIIASGVAHDLTGYGESPHRLALGCGY